MRPVTACDGCRSNKRKCRVDNRNSTCTRCRSLRLTCSLNGWSLQTPRSLAASLAPRPPQDALTLATSGDHGLSQELQKELVSLYFCVVHDTHHSIFHRPTVELQIEHGELPPVLLYSMLALGARFSDDPLFGETDRRRRGDEYAKRARSLLDLTEISVTTIQACILLGTISFSDSQMESEALYYSVALRLALILDLPQKHCSGRLDREINLRIWWSLYMIDIWSSMGLDLSRQLDFVDEYSLPTNEEDFLSITGGQSMTNAACPGLWSEMAKLTRIWARIHSFNKESLNRSINNHSLCVTIDNLAIELREWANGLPASLRETPANLDRYKALGLGNAFAALHLGYHYYNEVLFYQFLARNPTSTRQHDDIKSRYQARCEEHALAFCNLLYACRSANSQPNYQCLYVMVGHMLVVTSTVYIHMLLFSPELEKVELARHRLAKNFEILTQLRTFWATLDVALSRLQAFHNACRRSIEGSFRMDTWMLKFILEHGSSVGERPVAAGSMGDGNGEEPNALNSWFLRNF